MWIGFGNQSHSLLHGIAPITHTILSSCTSRSKACTSHTMYTAAPGRACSLICRGQASTLPQAANTQSSFLQPMAAPQQSHTTGWRHVQHAQRGSMMAPNLLNKKTPNFKNIHAADLNTPSYVDLMPCHPNMLCILYARTAALCGDT